MIKIVFCKIKKSIDKKNLGQFYTTNYNYILQNLFIPENIITIIEPFCGSGELLKFIDDNKYKIETFDFLNIYN